MAACLGHVRLLMRMLESGCPICTTAADGEPCLKGNDFHFPGYYPPGRKASSSQPDLTLVVSSDLVRSGPVLLLAAQKGAPLTLRMLKMLREVRRRALALAGCFHRAARPRRVGGAHTYDVGGRVSSSRARDRMSSCRANEWDAMGRVPIELIQNIATLARLSVVARELAE
jgi:hypothetical protein